jgi:hypothetical protein
LPVARTEFALVDTDARGKFEQLACAAARIVFGFMNMCCSG